MNALWMIALFTSGVLIGMCVVLIVMYLFCQMPGDRDGMR